MSSTNLPPDAAASPHHHPQNNDQTKSVELIYPKIKCHTYSKMNQDQFNEMDGMRDDDYYHFYRGPDSESMTSISLSTGPDGMSSTGSFTHHLNQATPPPPSQSPLSMSSWTEVNEGPGGSVNGNDADSVTGGGSDLGSDNVTHDSLSVEGEELGMSSDDVSCLDLSVSTSPSESNAGSQTDIGDFDFEETKPELGDFNVDATEHTAVAADQHEPSQVENDDMSLHDESSLTMHETLGASVSLPAELREFVECDAHDAPKDSPVHLEQTLRIINESELADINVNLDPSALQTTPKAAENTKYTLVMHQTASKAPLPSDEGQLKLFYFGPTERYVKSSIMVKLQEMLPRCEIISDDCISAVAVPPTLGNADATERSQEIHVRCRNSKPWVSKPENTKCSRYNIQSTQDGNKSDDESDANDAPDNDFMGNHDLVVLVIEDNESVATHNSRKACQQYAARHDIPLLLISEKPLWLKSSMTDNQLSTSIANADSPLHVCVESQHTDSPTSDVIGRYPVDLKTFDDMLPALLKQIFSGMISAKAKHAKEQNRSMDVLFVDMCDKVSKSYTHYKNKFSHMRETTMAKLEEGYMRQGSAVRVTSQLVISFILLVLLSLSLLTLTRAVRFLGNTQTGVVNWYTGSSSPIVTRTTMYTAATPTHFGAGFSSHDLDSHFSLLAGSGSSSETQPQQCASEHSGQDSTFQVYVIGDSHIIVKSPAGEESSSSPAFQDVALTRSADVIPFEMSHLFDGIYSLRLSRQNSWGYINVTITAKSKRSSLFSIPGSRPVTEKHITSVYFPDSVITFAERQWGHALSLLPTNDFFGGAWVNNFRKPPDLGGFFSRHFEKYTGKKLNDTELVKFMRWYRSVFRFRVVGFIPPEAFDSIFDWAREVRAGARSIWANRAQHLSEANELVIQASRHMQAERLRYAPKIIEFYRYVKKEYSELGPKMSRLASRLSGSVFRSKEVVTAKDRAKKLLIKIGAKNATPPPPSLPKRIGGIIMNRFRRLFGEGTR